MFFDCQDRVDSISILIRPSTALDGHLGARASSRSGRTVERAAPNWAHLAFSNGSPRDSEYESLPLRPTVMVLIGIILVQDPNLLGGWPSLAKPQVKELSPGHTHGYSGASCNSRLIRLTPHSDDVWCGRRI